MITKSSFIPEAVPLPPHLESSNSNHGTPAPLSPSQSVVNIHFPLIFPRSEEIGSDGRYQPNPLIIVNQTENEKFDPTPVTVRTIAKLETGVREGSQLFFASHGNSEK